MRRIIIFLTLLPVTVFCQTWPHDYPRLANQHFAEARGEAPADWYSRFHLVVSEMSSSKITETKVLDSDVKFVFSDAIAFIDDDNNIPACTNFSTAWYAVDSNGSTIMNGSWPMLDMTVSSLQTNLPNCFASLAFAGGYDGVGTDWLRDKPRDITDIDLDRNGVNDYTEHGTAWVDSTWQTGTGIFVANWRTEVNSQFSDTVTPIWINTGLLHGVGSATDIARVPGAVTYTNGLEMEMQPGFSSFNYSWGQYEAWIAQGRKPSVWITDTRPSASDSYTYADGNHSKNYYELMRMFLTFTLMGDGYFEFNPIEAGEHHFYSYYDEYDVPLGQPTSDPHLLANDVMVRFFDGGAVIMNPNSSQTTVQTSDISGLTGYSAPYYRFSGGQQPSFNNGSTFSSVTLDGHSFSIYSVGDGIILVKTQQAVVADIIIDNTNHFTSPASIDAQFTGTWTDGARDGSTDMWMYKDRPDREEYTHKYATGGSNATAEFFPTIGLAGRYEILEWHGNNTTLQEAPSVNYTINYSGGITTRTVNQTQNLKNWNSLGIFDFSVGDSNGVTISAVGASGYVIADAITFRYIGRSIESNGWQDRRSEWLNSAPEPSTVNDDMARAEYMSAWLERGETHANVYSGLQFMATLERSQRVQWFLRCYYAVKYGATYGDNTLVNVDAGAEAFLKSKVVASAENGRANKQATQPNKAFWLYSQYALYGAAFDANQETPHFGADAAGERNPAANKCHKTFTYNEHTYTFQTGGPYKIGLLGRDWLEHKLDQWVALTISTSDAQIAREMYSIHYTRAFASSLILLADGLELVNNPAYNTLKNKCRIAAEVILLHMGMNLSANNLGGTLGRTNWGRLNNDLSFPAYVYFGIGNKVTELAVEDVFMANWRPNQAIVNAVKMEGYVNTDWDVTHEHFGDQDRLYQTDTGKFIYRAFENYSIGGNYESRKNTGSQIVIRGDNVRSWRRFWFNVDASTPSNDNEENSLIGTQINLFKNSALFVGATALYYHGTSAGTVGSAWDDETTDGNYRFKKLGSVMIGIIGKNGVSKSIGLEIKLETSTYRYADFQTDIRGTTLTAATFINTDAVTISNGDNFGISTPGDQDATCCKRLETKKNGSTTIVTTSDDQNYAITAGGYDYSINLSAWTTTSTIPPVINTPPILASIGNTTFNAADTVAISLSATDDEGGAQLTFTVQGNISDGVAASTKLTDNGDGTADFSWITQLNNTGQYPLTFRVTDSDGLSDSEAMILTISVVAGRKISIIRVVTE